MHNLTESSIDQDFQEKSRGYSEVASLLLHNLAKKSDIPENWNVLVSHRIDSPSEMFIVQRESCENATIYVNAYHFISLQTKDKTWRERLAKFKMAAFKAIKLASKMSEAGSALITGDMAYAITEERKRIRRSLLEQSKAYLNPRYFTISGVIVVTDCLSGRQLSVDILPTMSLDSQASALYHNLSMMMLQDSETEALIDLLETKRSFQINEPPVEAVISVDSRTITTSLTYEES